MFLIYFIFMFLNTGLKNRIVEVNLADLNNDDDQVPKKNLKNKVEIVNKKIPAALFVVMTGIILSYLLNLESFGVKIIREIPSGLPSFGIPGGDVSNFYSFQNYF